MCKEKEHGQPNSRGSLEKNDMLSLKSLYLIAIFSNSYIRKAGYLNNARYEHYQVLFSCDFLFDKPNHWDFWFLFSANTNKGRWRSARIAYDIVQRRHNSFITNSKKIILLCFSHYLIKNVFNIYYANSLCPFLWEVFYCVLHIIILWKMHTFMYFRCTFYMPH